MSNTPISFPMFGKDFVVNPSRYFSLFGLKIYWYGLIIAIGFLLAFIYMIRKREEYGLTKDNILDIFIIVIPCGIIGARLYYVIFNSENYIGAGNWLNIVKIWEGGLAIYGGIIGSIIGLWLYARKKKIPLLTILDLSSLGVLIGQILGRWGNFFNREAHGGETDIFCRMGLTDPSGVTAYYHPTFLYESLWNLVGFILISSLAKKRKFDGQVVSMYFLWYGIGRFLIEGLRTDSLYLFNTGIRVSQAVAIITALLGLTLLIYNLLIRKKDGTDLYKRSAAGGGPASGENDIINDQEGE